MSHRQMRLMRAAVYHSFRGPIRIETIPIPNAPPNGVLIKVMATGVCRSDWHGWRGDDEDIRRHGLPMVPGHEFSGIVVEVGSGTTRFHIGDRVVVPFILSCGSCRECRRSRPTVCEDQAQPGFTMHGSFAEYVAIPRADLNVCPLPDGVSFDEAAALGCRFTTAYRAVVQRGRLKRGATLAVFGCGGLGLSCIMVGVAHGAKRIIAVDVSPQALSKAVSLGSSEAVDASSGDRNVRSRVLELTSGVGADVTVDAAGFISTCENAVWCARRGGIMVQVGLPIGGPRDPSVPMGHVAAREIDISGSHGFAAGDMPRILQLVAEGTLRPSLLIEKKVNLEEGAKCIEAMENSSPLGVTLVTNVAEQSRL